MDCITFCYSEPKFINKNIFEKYEKNTHEGCFTGGRSGTRTLGPLIKSQLLYQLS